EKERPNASRRNSVRAHHEKERRRGARPRKARTHPATLPASGSGDERGKSEGQRRRRRRVTRRPRAIRAPAPRAASPARVFESAQEELSLLPLGASLPEPPEPPCGPSPPHCGGGGQAGLVPTYWEVWM